jgi:hypothetical protein
MKGIPMDNDQINYIKHRLVRYEESIKETEDHFDQLESFGRYPACAPCYEKSGIPILIDALNANDDMCDTFWQEYDRITGKLNAFDILKGHVYRDLLYEDLKNYVAAYHSALCYADLNMITIESDHDLFNREAIRALLAELHKDYDTQDIENLVTTLDELFLRMKKTIDKISAKKSQVPEHAGYSPLMPRDTHFSSAGKMNRHDMSETP